MLQDTLLRVRAEPFLDPVVICNVAHRDNMHAQLSEIGVRPSGVVLEPFGRNTAAVAVAASLVAKDVAPGSLVLLMPADHVVGEDEAFRETIVSAARHAPDRIVTFGIAPTAPETGFGYIQSDDRHWGPVLGIRRFLEKPDLNTAKAFLASGDYLWNAGIFLFDPNIMLAEVTRYCPAVKAATSAALQAPDAAGDRSLDPVVFADCPSLAIDVAVMEKTELGGVFLARFGWSDIGSWSELWRLGPQDAAGNVIRGDGLVLDGKDSLLWSAGPTISVIGISDIVVIATPEHVLVLPKRRSQEVKNVLERRKRQDE